MRTCDLEPFIYQATPQTGAGVGTGTDDQVVGAGASSNQINEQMLQDYLARLIEALCADLQDLDARIAALENP